MIPSTPKQESVREHYPFLTSKARLRVLLRQNENITNKGCSSIEKDIEINNDPLLFYLQYFTS